MSSETSNNPFRDKPVTQSRLRALRERGYVVIVTRAFGPTGADLMAQDGPTFSGEVGVRLRVRQGDIEEDVVLSPFYGDPSKVFSQPFVEGQRCALCCPVTGEPLDKIPGMRSPDGAEYYAIYLSPRLREGELVAVNDIWGNADSSILSEGELLSLLAGLDDGEGH